MEIKIGYKIKEARKSAHLTQKELAEKSQVARTIIIGLENGTITTTTTTTLVKIARALKVPVQAIFFEDAV